MIQKNFNNAYVYLHRRLDTNEVFYVGIGSQKNFKRAYNKTNRGRHWKNIVKKTGLAVDIIYKNISWEKACEYEINLIAMYGRKDLGLGNLVNLTDGGKGTIRVKNSIKTKMNKSNSAKGKIVSVETRKNLSLACKGIPKTLEHKEKLFLNCPKKRKILDTKTGIVYDSITTAAKAKGYKRTCLQAYLSGQNINTSSLVYYLNTNADEILTPEYIEIYVKEELNKINQSNILWNK